MTAFLDNFARFGYSALLAVLLVSSVIVVAICLNPRVRTGMQIGRTFGFFLETDRTKAREKRRLGRTSV